MYGGAWMWNPNKIEEFEDDDESWEVKAFEQDIKDNISGTTWPPRYTCHFCRREFRSAQALGGHMNIHRRDRVSSRAHQGPTAVASSRSGSGTLVHSCAPPLPTTRVMIQSTASNIESLSHFYQLQNPSGSFGNSGHMTNLYGTTWFPSSNLAFPVFDSPAEVSPRLIEHSTRDYDESYGSMKETTGTSVDEPDLELRLGHNPP